VYDALWRGQQCMTLSRNLLHDTSEQKESAAPRDVRSTAQSLRALQRAFYSQASHQRSTFMDMQSLRAARCAQQHQLAGAHRLQSCLVVWSRTYNLTRPRKAAPPLRTAETPQQLQAAFRPPLPILSACAPGRTLLRSPAPADLQGTSI